MTRALLVSGKNVQSVREAAIGQVQHAIHSLEKQRNDESVHTARKACKRARAALRLMRFALGTPVYRSLNRRIRDAAKPLTSLRDASVLKDSLDALHTRCPELRQALITSYRTQRTAFEADGWQTSLANLRSSLEQLESSRSFSSETVSAIAGARKVYKAGRTTSVRAKSGTDEGLHEWRKQAKYLLSEFAILRAVFQVRFKKRRGAAHTLAEILGEDHDLAVLATIVSKQRIRRPALKKEIEKRRAELQHQARRVGAKLYRTAPRRFERKITRGLTGC
jgi:CHAD domain-containing protein